MTPFDAGALLVMLQSFYPVVSGSELARARRERPEYFASGALFGSHGDKLLLPDGRVFDCIFAAGGLPGTQRWQVIEPGPSVDEPYPLEPGPLTPLDLEGAGAPSSDPTAFQALVGGALAELAGETGVLDTAHSTLSGAADAGDRADAGGSELGDVAGAVDEVARAQSADALADILTQADGMSGAIASTDSDYADPPPQPQLPNEPDLPAGVPSDDGTGGTGREDPEKKPTPGDDDDTTHRRTPGDGSDG